MGARLSVSGKIGLVLILIVLCPVAGWKYWMMTRTWVPLYTPMSLAPGHFRTGEFKINLQETYVVYVQIDRKGDYQGTTCLLGLDVEDCKDKPDIVQVAWTLLDGGRVVAQGRSGEDHGRIGWGEFIGRNLGNFYVNGGRHYVLDVSVLGDGSRLNPADPHLVVENAGSYWEYEAYGDYAFWPLLIVLPVGMTLLLCSIAELRAERRERKRIPLAQPGNSDAPLLIGEGPSPGDGTPEKTKPKLRLHLWLGVGLVFFGLAAYAGIQHWLDTRIFVPVDVPISLVPGHIRTGPFKTNLEAGYSIEIKLDPNPQIDWNCSSYYLQTKWVLYRDGQMVEQSYQPPNNYSGTYLGGFSAEKGTYDLDLELQPIKHCLGASRGRLRVYANGKEYVDDASRGQWLAALCVGIGLGLLAMFVYGPFREQDSEVSITGAASVGQNFQWARMQPLRRSFSGFPSFGIVGGGFFFFLLIMYTIIAPRTPTGLKVRLLSPGALPVNSDAWTEPLIVRLQDVGPGLEPRLYVNSREIAWNDLDRTLKQELGRRKDWTVYVGGDAPLAWGDITRVINVARGDHAKVFLVTQFAGKN
jgi:biopolymer transport protein ExbD